MANTQETHDAKLAKPEHQNGRRGVFTLLLGLAILGSAATAFAAPPRLPFIPFKRIDVDPKKSYEITPENGPWMVFAASFIGDGAEEQAHELVMELRQGHRLPAYIHRKHFDYTEPVQGLGVNRFGEIKKMRHVSAKAFDEIAVFVGNYEDLDDPDLQKTLKKIKFMHPESLDLTTRDRSTQRFAGWRYFSKLLNDDEEQRKKGQMGGAFATRNPIRPDENKAASGLDPLVLEMNQDAEFSLLRNRGKFTVKVATFQGVSTSKLDEIAKLERGQIRGKLEEAAVKAHKLARALRAEGVDAYEFHDRHESIVCVGGFESVGKDLEGGQIDIDPQILEIMRKYGAEQKPIPGQAVVGLSPRTLNGIPFDVTPVPIEVPKVSIAASYVRSPLR
ncbi:MAG: hypothetical protein ACKO38_15820 [Planctomycetota bacterium]